jgi:hypothetical protein
MATITPAYIKAIAASHPTATVWEAETTLTAREITSAIGVAVSPGDSENLLYGIGDYDSTPAPIYVKAERGGYPDGGARYCYSADSATWYGWDEPSMLATFAPVDVYTGSANRAGCVALAEHASGQMIAVACKSAMDAADGTGGLRCYRRAWGGGWVWCGDAGLDGFTSDPLGDYPDGWGPCVAMDTGSDGTIYLAMLVHSRNRDGGTAYMDSQVWIFAADPTATFSAGGTLGRAAFQLRSRAVLDTPIRCEIGGGKRGPGSMAMAIGGGQCLLLVTTQEDGVIHQYAGPTPDALRKIDSAVTCHTGTGTASHIAAHYTGGAFVCAWWTYGATTVTTTRLGDATLSLDSAALVVPTDIATAGGVALSDDGTGRIFLTTLVGDATGIQIVRSDDGGASWSAPDTFAPASIGYADTVGFAAHWWRDRLVTAYRSADAGGHENSLVSCEMGGWTRHAMPPVAYVQGGSDPRLGRLAFDATWTTPAQFAMSLITPSITGTPTIGMDSGMRMTVSCGAGDTADLTPATVPYSGTTRGWYYRSIGVVTTGIVSHYVTDGSTLGVLVTQTPTTLTIRDVATLAVLDTYDVTGFDEVDLLVWIDLDVSGTTATVNVYAREHKPLSGPRAYAGAYTGPLTIGTVLAASHLHAHSLSDIALTHFAYTETNARLDLDPPLPVGRPLSSSPTYTVNGISVAAARGPLVTGERWMIVPWSQYGAENALATRTAPNRATRFETSDTTAGYIAWQISDTAMPVPPLWLAWIESNAQKIEIAFHDGSSWGSNITVKGSETVSLDGAGLSVYVHGTGAAASRYHTLDDLVGGWIRIGSDSYRILGSSPGLATAMTKAGMQTLMRVDANVGSLSSTSGKIAPPRAVTALTPGTAVSPFRVVKGFRLRLSGDPPPEGYWTLKAVVGPALVLGFPHGRDTRRTYTPRVQDDEAPSGFGMRTRLGPVEQIVELSWQNAIDPLSRRLLGIVSTEPDRIDDADGNPIYTVGSTTGDVFGMIDSWASYGDPVCYHPSISLAEANAPLSVQREMGSVMGRIEQAWTLEDINGEEQRSHLQRGGTLTIRTGA